MRDRRRSTLQDVARQAGVSVGTASGVFSNHASVSEEARAAVLAAASRIGYRPRRRVAAGLDGLTAIGLVARPEHYIGPGNPFYGPVLHGAQTAAAELGIPLVLETLRQNALGGYDLPVVAERRHAQGLLLVGYVSPGDVQGLLDGGVPCVIVDHRDDDVPIDSVCDDDYTGGYLATRHLLERGHREPAPAIIAGPPYLWSICQRVAGYRSALADAGLAVDPAFVRQGNLNPDGGREQMAALLDLPTPPSAVFCCNDFTALGALDVLRERGVSVPAEFSVIGYDDIAMAAHSVPALTTVAVDKELLGMQAVWTLLQRIRQPRIEIRETRLRVRLVERGSTAQQRTPTTDRR